MSIVKLLDVVDGIMSVKTYLKGDFGFSRFLELAFLFMEDIWHDVQKGYESILSSISSQTLALSPANNDMVDLFPNIWCNNSKACSFLDVNIFVFDISFISPKNACLFCAICGNVRIFSLLLRSTLSKTLCGINKYVPNSLML